MVNFSLISRCAVLSQLRRTTSRGNSSLVVVAVLVLGISGFSHNAWGQIGYPAPSQFSDPGQVFTGGMDFQGPSTPSSRRSAYSDYRCNAYGASQFGPSTSPQYNNGSQFNSGGSCCNRSGSNGPQGFGSPSPYASGYGSAPLNAYDPDPRFPSPYAGSLYRTPGPVPVPQDPNGPFDPNVSGPGGWSSPGSVGVADPNLGYGANRGDCTLYMPFASLGYLGGTTPSSTYDQLFVPLLQSHTEMLYADFRGLYSNQSAYMGSFGGGLRTLLRDSVILGGYGFYDYYGSPQHNQFQQVTVGVELLTWIWEARSNGYIPTTQGSNGSGGTPGVAVLQNGLIFLGGTQQTSLSGVDGELGALIAADATAQKELRLFAGGYNFTGSGSTPNIPGVYGRLEARLYDLNFLGQGSRLEFGVISSYDDVNRLQVTGMLNVRIAFGSTNCPGGMSLIERRMLDRVVRRATVVTSNQSTPADTGSVVINGNTSNNVVLVDPNTPNIQSVINAAPTHSLIVVEGGPQHVLVPNGITLNPGQTLVGGGSSVTVTGNTTGQKETLTLPGSTPIIERNNAVGPTITMTSNTSVVGVNILGGMPGIYANGANNLFVSNVNTSLCGCDGMQFLSVTGLTINNVTIDRPNGLGLLLQNVNNLNIDNLAISQTKGSSIFYTGGSNAQINGVTINATGATDDAVKFQSVTNGMFTNFQINNTTSNYNALTVMNSSGLTFNQMNLTNITGDGVVLNGSSNVALNLSVFTNVNNDIGFINTLSQISGYADTSTGQNSVFTGTTNGGGSIQFTSPNVTAQ